MNGERDEVGRKYEADCKRSRNETRELVVPISSQDDMC